MLQPDQHLHLVWPDRCHQKHLQVALHQVLQPDCDRVSPSPKPSSTSLHHEYPQASHLAQARASVEVHCQTAEEADQHLSEALAEAVVVQSPGASVEEGVVHRCLALVEVEALDCLASVVGAESTCLALAGVVE